MTRKKNHSDAPAPDSDQTEAERQGEAQVWPRAFGVSTDDLGGALDEGDGDGQDDDAHVSADRQK